MERSMYEYPGRTSVTSIPQRIGVTNRDDILPKKPYIADMNTEIGESMRHRATIAPFISPWDILEVNEHFNTVRLLSEAGEYRLQWFLQLHSDLDMSSFVVSVWSFQSLTWNPVWTADPWIFDYLDKNREYHWKKKPLLGPSDGTTADRARSWQTIIDVMAEKVQSILQVDPQPL